MASAVARIERGHQMYREGKHEEALWFYTEALSMAKTKQQRIALHSNRAACYLKLHDFKKASEECTSVLELDHQHAGALMLRAQTLVTIKEYQSALFDVNRLMDINPSSDVYRNLQLRLKIQLSLATIHECEEEELLVHEEEDDNEEEKEGNRSEEKETIVLEGMEKKIKSPRKPSIAVVQMADANDNFGRKLLSPRGEPVDAVLNKPNAEDTVEKIEFDKPKDSAIHQKIVKDSSVAHPQGWEAIPTPRGHSGLDYSRWDRVEDDSSEDEEDKEQEQQPCYRFRVRTLGERSLK